MENAAEAMKLILGVTIFGLALTVLFRMTSLARDTADQMFETIDSTIYEQVEQSSAQTKTIQEIIPSLYRYVQEGYAITIIDSQGNTTIGHNNIVAMFDSAIEGTIVNCQWNENQYKNSSETERMKSNNYKKVIEQYINKNILNDEIIKDYTITQINEGSETSNADFLSHSELNSLAKKLFKNIKIDKTENTSKPVFASWQASNRDRDSYITQRVNCDIYGGETFFSSRYSGVSDTNNVSGGHKAVCDGNGLLTTYAGAEFIEYVKVIDRNSYVEDSDLLEYGTIRYAKKREIIYVKK